MNMCRFTGITDDGYRKFKDVLNTYVQELQRKCALDEQAERQLQRESLDSKLPKLCCERNLAHSLFSDPELMRTLDFAERRSREYQLENIDTDQSSFSWIWCSVFADWLSSSKPLFWLRGKPASGKSTLTKYLVRNDRTYSKLREYKNCEWLTIYFFFDFRGGKGMNNSFEGLLRSLLVQLLDAIPELKEYVPSESSANWHEARLRECLLSVFDHSSKCLCLFIDGLDEYEGDMLQLLRFLKKLQNVGENSRTPPKIYVSSRPEPVPSQLLEGTPSLSMSEENGRGIRSYVQSTMKDMPSKMAEDPQWRTLCDEIVNRADGVFLWARFALDELVQGFCKGESIDELSARLESVPDELEGIYKRVIERMEPQARNEAFVMLQIPCSTQRSLLLQEFLVAMTFAMETDPSIRKVIGGSELVMFSRRVRAKSGGLLEIIEEIIEIMDEDDSDDKDGSEAKMENAQNESDEVINDDGIEEREKPLSTFEVKLTHKTVKTFLDKCGWQLLQPQRQILPCDGDLLLLNACSKYLKEIFDSFHYCDNESPVAEYITHKSTDFQTLYPFLEYSASFLFHHARRLEIIGNISSYAYIKEVLTPKFGTVHVAACRRSPFSECLCRSIWGIWERYPYNATSRFAHGLPKTCEEVIGTYTGDESFSIDEALNEAILSSFVTAEYEPDFLRYDLNTLSLVLSRITQIKQSHLERAMAIAAPVDVLRLLLGHQSFENLQIFTNNGQRATLLWLLIYSAIKVDSDISVATLKLIVEKGEDLNEPCGSDGTALDYAVSRKSDFWTALIIEALVNCGAYKTMIPVSLSKPIGLIDGSGTLRDTTLRVYLAGEDGFRPGSTRTGTDSLEYYLATSAGYAPSNSGGGRT